MPLPFSIDDISLSDFMGIASRFGSSSYAYVVTPNVDHIIRYVEDPPIRELYDDADFVMMDSRFLARILVIARRQKLHVCPGSDVTAQMFAEVIGAEDNIVMVGGSNEQAAMLRSRYGLRGLQHFNPPMGFIRDRAAVEQCLEFIENASPFRYCLLAIGSPQQEIIARQLKRRGIARGLALCVGASIDFLSGKETRAPIWMQKLALEWLYRLARNPGRLASRYLVRGPRIFLLLRHIAFVPRSPSLTEAHS